MRYLECDIPESVGYLIPIGDLHVGDKAFNSRGLKLLLDYLDWVKQRPSARIFLIGDIFNVAGRLTKTSPFETDTNEYVRAAEFFEPYKDKIIGAIDGNHEARMLDMFGLSPLQVFCAKLGIEYCEWSAVVRFNVGKRAGNRSGQVYHGYFHHSTGGGSTIGGKLNRATKLREIVEGMDFYCIGHNHQLAAAPQDVYHPALQGKRVDRRRIWFIDCGSYLEWDGSYAERGMMAPTKLGSPRIRMSGVHHKRDVHVSI